MSSAKDFTLSDAALHTIILTYVLLCLALSLAVDHVYLRWKRRIWFRWADIAPICAFNLSLALVGQVTWSIIQEGLGQHVSTLETNNFGAMVRV